MGPRFGGRFWGGRLPRSCARIILSEVLLGLLFLYIAVRGRIPRWLSRNLRGRGLSLKAMTSARFFAVSLATALTRCHLNMQPRTPWASMPLN